jgi:hypothetical protein
MEQLLTVTSIMVANGKTDVKLLNSYLKDYHQLVFGKTVKEPTGKTDGKEIMNEQINGFRKFFKNVTLKPKFGKKIESEFSNVNFKDLMKMEKK